MQGKGSIACSHLPQQETTVPRQLPALLVQGQQDTPQRDPSMRTTIAASETEKFKTGDLRAGFFWISSLGLHRKMQTANSFAQRSPS